MRRLVALLACAAACAVQAKEVALDVGHYKAEPGAISARGRAEFEFNLQLARMLFDALKAAGVRVRMIGERGDMVQLISRVRAANGADLLVSIHHDSVKEHLLGTWVHEGVERRYNDGVSGFSLFVSRANPHLDRALACASRIGESLRAAGFRPSRYHADPVLGENRPFADEQNGVHYYDQLAVGRAQSAPSVLVEAGVIVNRDEELRMRDPAVHDAIARAIARGVTRCL